MFFSFNNFSIHNNPHYEDPLNDQNSWKVSNKNQIERKFDSIRFFLLFHIQKVRILLLLDTWQNAEVQLKICLSNARI